MRNFSIVLSVALAVSTGCRTGQESRPAPAASPAAAAPAASTAPSQPAAAPDDDLVSFASGALVVGEPEPDSVNAASWLIRGPFDTEYVWKVRAHANQAVVIEMPERSLVARVEFDTAMVTAAQRQGGHRRDVGHQRHGGL